MTRVETSCTCGAVLIIQSPTLAERREMMQMFVHAHASCRMAAALRDREAALFPIHVSQPISRPAAPDPRALSGTLHAA